jgi:propanediol utilization protein
MIKIPIEISARHLHISQADLNKLFGAGYKLKTLRLLGHCDEFAAKETVTLVGPKGLIKSARIVGPTRQKTQLEISLTDAQALGIKPPFRVSGNLNGAAKITLVGPAGQITTRAAIIALRHLHINPAQAKKLKLKDGQIIKIKISGARGVIFDKVAVRVKPNFKLVMHLDTDEANAAGLRGPKNYGEII